MIGQVMIEFVKKLYGSVTSRTRCVRCTTLLLACSICLFLGACHVARRHTTQSSTAKPILFAEPNPIPAGDPGQALATAKITWDTGDETTGDLYVKIDRADEVFIARAPSGTMKIDWIQFDSRYEFRLYAKKRSKLLTKLEVTRDD
jgi:hypothetical protein